MDVISNKDEMIFKSERNGKVLYSIGLSKRNQDGTYDKGYMSVRFKKDVSLSDKTKIHIKQAWLDFYKIEKKTLPYIFINEFDVITQTPQVQDEKHDEWGSAKDIHLTQDDLPFYG